MKQIRIPAVFMRGGTRNAVVFHAQDLPADRALWDEIFLAAIGSPGGVFPVLDAALYPAVPDLARQRSVRLALEDTDRRVASGSAPTRSGRGGRCGAS